MIKNRDKVILEDLKRFRCLSRNDIIDLHFKYLKNPITNCNIVLKRLRRDGLIEANTSQQPYVYFSSPSPIKKDSQKIPHFLEIVNVYKQLIRYEQPKHFTVEPKYSKEYMEPDIFTIWKKAPFFIEVQRSHYSDKVMFAKLQRYQKYYDSGAWREETWQPQNKKIFPTILIITDTQYKISDYGFQIYQASSIDEFLTTIPEEKPKPKQIVIGGGTNLKVKGL